MGEESDQMRTVWEQSKEGRGKIHNYQRFFELNIIITMVLWGLNTEALCKRNIT